MKYRRNHAVEFLSDNDDKKKTGSQHIHSISSSCNKFFTLFFFHSQSPEIAGDVSNKKKCDVKYTDIYISKWVCAGIFISLMLYMLTLIFQNRQKLSTANEKRAGSSSNDDDDDDDNGSGCNNNNNNYSDSRKITKKRARDRGMNEPK